MTYAWISDTDHSWDGIEHDSDEAPEGYSPNAIPPSYSVGLSEWNPSGEGWKDLVDPSDPEGIPITSLRLLKRMSLSQRTAMYSARDTDPELDDALNLLVYGIDTDVQMQLADALYTGGVIDETTYEAMIA